MDTVKSIEAQLVDLNKTLPKLPAGLTKWLADYGWLLVLISVILSIMTLVTLVPLLLLAFGVSTAVGVGNLFAGYGFNPAIAPLAWLSISISFVTLLFAIVVEAMAITPLKNKQHRGWQLIFIVMLVSTALSIVASIVTLQPGSLVINLVVYAIGFYVLFQLRPHFMPQATTSKKAPAYKPAQKE